MMFPSTKTGRSWQTSLFTLTKEKKKLLQFCTPLWLSVQAKASLVSLIIL